MKEAPKEQEIKAILIALKERRIDEDVIQETFVRLLENWDKIDDPMAWAGRTAVNLKYDFMRRDKRQAQLSTALQDEAPSEAGEALEDAWMASLPGNQTLLDAIYPEWREKDIGSLTKIERRNIRAKAERYWKRHPKGEK